MVAWAAASVEFPRQFVAVIETTAHLIEKSSEYPPRRGRVRVLYDLENGRTRADMLVGLDAGKNYTRRYDLKQEYRVRGGEYPSCGRCYLVEAMPAASLPDARRDSGGDAVVDGQRLSHWIIDHTSTDRSRVYATHEGLPRRLVNEIRDRPDGDFEPLMTYDVLHLDLVAPSEAAFALDAPWSHDNCTRYVGGWPYIHLFHHYLRI